MTKLRLAAPLAASIAGLTGCYASTVVDGYKVWENRWAADAATVRARAAFDLSCPAPQVTLQVIGVELPPSAFNNATVGNAKTIGATGCGNKATYIRVKQDWVMNGASKNTAEGPGTRGRN